MTVTKASWYFDFVSPFSYLQLAKVLQWRDRLDITPKPIALGAVLKHCGQLGPAEIPGKREFMYRFVLWQAEHTGAVLRFPPQHPFNPLAALRLCIAAGTTWAAIEAIFHHLWRDGRPGATAAELAEVGHALGIGDVESAINDAQVKNTLRANTDGAIAAGVFGVPALKVGNEMFWGNDATPMIEDWLAHPRRFDTDEYRRIATLPLGIERRR
ncbi:MAG: 2-hydroxychromene-2-carboxylate isomerase [Proteobacteria bacterium]|uniref:2-hydroxychromene-2-carboxylate isomerase n=1 Tax=Rudaea sp. TaxID=2136325 RepID=UPI001DE35BF3|nr:2-hydroxychromene-2-carboxylate isomerase [Pseudomonadota bacterium]MBS0568117.1 2-hydroxychromene-2-carboxylate isomerase [Pseudomonadota bacterium]